MLMLRILKQGNSDMLAIDGLEQVIATLKTERECVLRNEHNLCNRDCLTCDLALPTKQVVDSYDCSIDILEGIKREIELFQELGMR